MDYAIFIDSHPTAIIILTGVLGLIIGSFINVVVYRYPKMIFHTFRTECMQTFDLPIPVEKSPANLFRPRSHCPHCKQTLSCWQNIPVISFLILRGRCHFCDARISYIYPCVELLSAILAMLVVAQFGPTATGYAALLFTWGLICLSFIDIKEHLIPDDICLSLLWIGLLINTYNIFTSASNAIFGAIIPYVFLWVIAKIYEFVRNRQGMGHGDFKLFAMIGAWLGTSILLNTLLWSIILGLLVGSALILSKKITRDHPIAFGPFLAIGGWLSLIYGPFLSDWLVQFTLGN